MESVLKVLIIEDQPGDVELTLHHLRQAGFEPNWRPVHFQTEYLKALNSNFGIIFADFTLPHLDGIHALQHI